jgi:phosphate transport system substrate-binding protein
LTGRGIAAITGCTAPRTCRSAAMKSVCLNVALALSFAVSMLSGAAVCHAQEKLTGKVTVDGSSTVYPITEAVAEEFSHEHRAVRVTVGISGTGGGFKRFAAGETDVSNASRPIKFAEMEAAQKNSVEFIELPVAYDGLSVVVNHDNTWAKQLTIEQLRKIFLDGGATNWNQIDPSYPDLPLKVYSPGTDSGTFDYFKEVVIEKGSFRSDASVSEDDNVLVRGVAGDKGAIGFFGCAYYFENRDKVSAVAIVNHDGQAIMPTHDSIEDGSYNPLSRPLFIYVNRKSADRPEVGQFIEFYFDNAAELAEEVGYVKLPKLVTDRARANFAGRKVGTAYWTADGKPIHGPVTKVYQ